ncbi:MAG: hypothetical protein GY720_15600 [bacterium]|nr:hypothetical protein [bacterium]
MKKVLAALAASGVLVAGGFATAAVSAPTSAIAQETTDESTATTDDVVRPERGAILEEVLDQLVADGVITDAQATQIADALEAKHDELREEFGDRRGGHGFRGGGDHRGLMDALEDGVIDADELAELPEGHPLTDPDGPAAQYLDDGQLTQEELEQMRAEFGSQRGPRGHGFGGPAPSEEASASA